MSGLSKAENIPVAAVEFVEELTEEEAADRQRLEMKVERAFFEAGCALRDLLYRRLYKSTHKSFYEYCRDRFNFTRASAYYLISAADVMDNLLSKCQQIVDIFPTKENQCRELAKLSPEQQPEAWLESVSRTAGRRVPPASTIKSVVQEIKERDNTPPPIPFQVGDVVEICTGSHNGCWGIVTHVGIWSCTVHISVRNVNVQFKVNEMEKVDPPYTAEIRAVSERIAVLTELDLDPVIWSILETLSRQTCFTQIQLNSLAWAEQQYGISRFESKNIKKA